MNKKVCRLCLQTITEHFQPVEPCLKDILKLNLNISKTAVRCMECSNNLKVFLKFKLGCDYLTEETLAESKGEERCRFCAKFSGKESLTPINERKEFMFLVSVLKEHIPKMNINIAQELLTCETCLNGLQSVLRFVLKYMDVEQKINQYTETKRIDDIDQIELNDVQQLIFAPAVKSNIKAEDVQQLIFAPAVKSNIKAEDVQQLIFTPALKSNIKAEDVNDLSEEKYDRFQENHDMGAQAEIKYETEIENPVLNIKTEDIDIKSEQSDCESFSFQESPTEIDNGSSDISASKSQRCINQHDVTDKDSVKMEMYECETKQWCYLKQHESTQESTSETTMFKCDLCSFVAKHERKLKRHELTHKKPSDLTVFKCKVCEYESKHKFDLMRHQLIHKAGAILKCDLCTYKTKHVNNFKRHALRHRSATDLTMFKCELCLFETKHKAHLQEHKLLHISTSDVKMYKCLMCPFKAKQKSTLKTHKLRHKSTSDLRIFLCDLCSYGAKQKSAVDRHMMTHESVSEITMFKCELCPFQTIHQNNLDQHTLTHKSESDTKVYKCELCSYVTKRRPDLFRHGSVHKNTTM